MIILYAYLLSCLIFAIAMVVEAMRSDKYKQDDVWHKAVHCTFRVFYPIPLRDSYGT